MAMAMTMKYLPHHLVGKQIIIFAINWGRCPASQPKFKSGQASIEELYNAVYARRKGGNSISLV